MSTLFDSDGIMVRFMNSPTEGNGIRDAAAVNALMQQARIGPVLAAISLKMPLLANTPLTELLLAGIRSSASLLQVFQHRKTLVVVVVSPGAVQWAHTAWDQPEQQGHPAFPGRWNQRTQPRKTNPGACSAPCTILRSGCPWLLLSALDAP